MADEAIDSRIVDILSRLNAIETTMHGPNDDEKQESNIENVQKDNRHRIRADLEDLKSRLAALNDSDGSDKSDNASDNASDTSSVSENATTEFLPQLNRVTWTQFMNPVAGDDQYAIDVLIGPVKSHWQIRQEKTRLPQSSADETKLDHGTSNLTVGKSEDPTDVGARTPANERNETQSEVPERIRINCPKLSATISDATGLMIRSECVLIRPYKLLVRHEEALRQRFRELQVRHEKDSQDTLQQQPWIEGDQPNLANAQNGDTGVTAPHNNELVAYTNVKEHEEELQGLKCLLEFMDIYLVPVVQRYRSPTAEKIRFGDLWYLYRPGDLVVMTNETRNESKNKGSHQAKTRRVPLSLCRVLSVSQGRPDLATLHGPVNASKPSSIKTNDFRIQGHTIAYDGTSFGPVHQKFEIAPFQGEREISALDPCPLRYAEGSADLQTRLVERGIEFMQYTKPRHCRYAGPTFSEHQNGIYNSVAEKSTMIDGYIIVDFKEARSENLGWVLEQDIIDADRGIDTEVSENELRSLWRDKERTEFKMTLRNDIFDDDRVDSDEQDDLVEGNAFLTAWKSGKPVNQEYLQHIDHALLPSRVVGYDLYRHKFAILALEYLQPVQASTEGWADLKLPTGHKRMVQAQIRTHFLRKMSRQNHTSNDTDIDIVRGKGLGLIILLHGAPGVGKTSTAECVAESLGKPLYPITCGDLGVTAESVERTLASTFAKAEAWDCVLLLDEADVFLAQRTRTDLERNAIVSGMSSVYRYIVIHGLIFDSISSRVGILQRDIDSNNQSCGSI